MEQVLSAIRDLQLLKKGDRCLLGLSGGPDSMALACLLIELKKSLDFDLVFCHLHHGLRGPEADRDLAFVKKWTGEKGYPLVWGYVDVRDYAKKGGLSEEEAGRILRHKFLRDQAGPGGKVALAHNFDDQAETILHRILRGTGPDGLKGMAMKEGPLIRPLLRTRRRDILAYLDSLGQDYCIDSTNAEEDYTRNYLRHRLLPMMKEVNPKSKEALVRLGDLAALDRDYFEKRVDQIFKDQVRLYSRAAGLKADFLRGLDPALRYRLYRKIFEEVGETGLKNLGYDHLKEIDSCLDFSSGKGLDLVGLRVEKSYEDLIFYQRRPRPRPLSLKPGLNQGDLGTYSLYFTEEAGEKGLALKDGEDLRLRSRQDGDRILLRGKEVKLKDLFQEKKIPKPFRDFVGVLEGKEIYAVGPYRSDHWTQEGRRLVVRKEKRWHTN